jgi:hypothetical protein
MEEAILLTSFGQTRACPHPRLRLSRADAPEARVTSEQVAVYSAGEALRVHRMERAMSDE